MSLVGPRPALAWEADLYEARHHRRFEVKPGITRLRQVRGRIPGVRALAFMAAEVIFQPSGDLSVFRAERDMATQQVVPQGQAVLGPVAGVTHIPVRKLQQPDVSRLVPASPLEGPLRPQLLQAPAVGALVGLFLTAGIALALLRPRAQHVDSGWE